MEHINLAQFGVTHRKFLRNFSKQQLITFCHDRHRQHASVTRSSKAVYKFTNMEDGECDLTLMLTGKIVTSK